MRAHSPHQQYTGAEQATPKEYAHFDRVKQPSEPLRRGRRRKPGQLVRRATVGRVLLGVWLSMAILTWDATGNAGPPGPSIPAQLATGAVDHSEPVGPVASWLDDIQDLLREMFEIVTDGDYWVNVGNPEGPLDEPERSYVAGDLDEALAIIATILDPAQYPSLVPYDAGTIDTTRPLVALSDYSSTCATLAEDALDEAESKIVDHEIIGSRLKTIEHLITRTTPHNYRTKAGIGLSSR